MLMGLTRIIGPSPPHLKGFIPGLSPMGKPQIFRRLHSKRTVYVLHVILTLSKYGTVFPFDRFFIKIQMGNPPGPLLRRGSLSVFICVPFGKLRTGIFG